MRSPEVFLPHPTLDNVASLSLSNVSHNKRDSVLILLYKEPMNSVIPLSDAITKNCEIFMVTMLEEPGIIWIVANAFC